MQESRYNISVIQTILSKLEKKLFLCKVSLITFHYACKKLVERSGNFSSDNPLDVLFWQPSIEVILGETEQGTR